MSQNNQNSILTCYSDSVDNKQELSKIQMENQWKIDKLAYEAKILELQQTIKTLKDQISQILGNQKVSSSKKLKFMHNRVKSDLSRLDYQFQDNKKNILKQSLLNRFIEEVKSQDSRNKSQFWINDELIFVKSPEIIMQKSAISDKQQNLQKSEVFNDFYHNRYKTNNENFQDFLIKKQTDKILNNNQVSNNYTNNFSNIQRMFQSKNTEQEPQMLHSKSRSFNSKSSIEQFNQNNQNQYNLSNQSLSNQNQIIFNKSNKKKFTLQQMQKIIKQPIYKQWDLQSIKQKNDLANEILIQNNTQKPLKEKNQLKTNHILRSHLDGVRSLYFTAQDNLLVSASEDGLLKLWDASKFIQTPENIQIDPYITLRQHIGPVFTVTGNQQQQNQFIKKKTLLFSSGQEGIIRIWAPPLPHEIKPLRNRQYKNYYVGSWNSHSNIVWDLQYHPQEEFLASSSADGTIKLWQVYNDHSILSQGNILQTFQKLNLDNGKLEIPTSLCWTMDSILTGYADRSFLSKYDVETGQQTATLEFNKLNGNPQANKVLLNNQLNCIISAHEDKQIRFFDMNSNKLEKQIVAHSDAVTSISCQKNCQYLMASVGHDSSLRIWDIRKYQCLYEITAHRKKYDESIHSVLFHPSLNILATAGAEGLVRIFQQIQ